MALYRKCMMASSIAIAISLTACGGGSGGVASVPVPPTPTPPATPGTKSISAAALAIVPNANLFPPATTGGPTMQAHPMTVFPLLQSVVSINSGGLVADTATMNGGATLKFNSTGNIGNDSYEINIGNPAIGISNQPLLYDWCGQCAQVGNNSVDVVIADPATSNLGWTTYGLWEVHLQAGPATIRGAFVTGYETPAGSVPTSGTAAYKGSVIGQVMSAEIGQEIRSRNLSGDASLQANFASGSITGSLTNMTAMGSLPWNNVSLQGSISSGQNSFSGTTAVTSPPENGASLSSSATGTFAGRFFGPGAQELGAVWTLFDGTSTAIGSIGATNNPTGAGHWDY